MTLVFRNSFFFEKADFENKTAMQKYLVNIASLKFDLGLHVIPTLCMRAAKALTLPAGLSLRCSLVRYKHYIMCWSNLFSGKSMVSKSQNKVQTRQSA